MLGIPQPTLTSTTFLLQGVSHAVPVLSKRVVWCYFYLALTQSTLKQAATCFKALRHKSGLRAGRFQDCYGCAPNVQPKDVGTGEY